MHEVTCGRKTFFAAFRRVWRARRQECFVCLAHTFLAGSNQESGHKSGRGAWFEALSAGHPNRGERPSFQVME
ncbi:hypothetical protein D7M11_06090 [Paenibacillus ginsengarvi]|uniref:Uncharacterized protein n=1 Tax=Paenibacillus ginsengarvi TaxID=400777 RepID=A0A3B0CM02_9BACL|nr:hypothetical protein D7M11_06090 [Paenibacillus ginsengarvi]